LIVKTGLFAKAKGWQGMGLEISDYARDIAINKNRLDVLRGPLEEAGLANSSFDVVCASDVLEHMNDPNSFLN